MNYLRERHSAATVGKQLEGISTSFPEQDFPQS